MSTALLAEVYNETRRLVIAGSSTAPGDFRLKKLVPSLEQVGAKAPVFAKLAEAGKRLIDSDEKSAPPLLMELISLISAVLYTQGATGFEGEVESIGVTTPMESTAQFGARTLKPVLEALVSTGPGRLDVIRSAFEQGMFSDFRLMTPANIALDDSYHEIGTFVADQILALYGENIVPVLAASFNPKGATGDGRRLRYMHRLNPVTARPYVLAAMEESSPEVRIAAIESLGAYPEDLSTLLELSRKGAKEARRAAFAGLSRIDDPASLAELRKAISGKSLEFVAQALSTRADSPLLDDLLEEFEKTAKELFAATDPAQLDQHLRRIQLLISALNGNQDPRSNGPLLELFAKRAVLVQMKGSSTSGNHLLYDIVRDMAAKSYPTREALIQAHRTLHADHLETAFGIAVYDLDPTVVFEEFSPYLGCSDNRKGVIIGVLTGESRGPYLRHPLGFELDARWLDAVITIGNYQLASRLAEPGDPRVHNLLQKVAAREFSKSEILQDCYGVVSAMVRFQHPDATDVFMQAIEKHGEHGGRGLYIPISYGELIPFLPKSAIPRLEALRPRLREPEGDTIAEFIESLKALP